METERYIVNFYSVGDKQFGITDVKKLWIAAALVEEAGCGVFINGVKMCIRDSHHAPYDLGYTRATMVVTK